MKTSKQLPAFALAAILVLPFICLGDSKADAKTDTPKPYPLDTCIVLGEKLGSCGMKTYTFVHEGQEVKLCCKSCLKEFKKDTAKYLKKIQAAQAKAEETPKDKE